MSTNSNINLITSIAYILAEKCNISQNSLENGFFSVETDFSDLFTELDIISLSGTITFTDQETDNGTLTTIDINSKLAKVNQANNSIVQKLKSGRYLFKITDAEGIVYLLGHPDHLPSVTTSGSIGQINTLRGYQIKASIVWQYGLVLSE